MYRYLVIVSCIFINIGDSARILGVFPIPSISHQVVFRALTQELARRGHELVIVTPDPALPKNRPPDNITEIDVHFGYDILKSVLGANQQVFMRGTIHSEDFHLIPNAYLGLVKMVAEMLDHKEVRKIISDKSQHFDLILVEAFLNYQMVVSEIFDAPMIIFSSFHGLPDSFEAVGAIIQHPVLYPSSFSVRFEGVSIFDRFKQAEFEFKYHRAMKEVEYFEDTLLKQYFGLEAPTVRELRNNVDMLFINSNPIFCDNKPLPPNAVYVGPLHLLPLKDLPQEMKTFLDNTIKGVIYVSLGTNVNPAFMEKELLDSFVEAFRELPYDILWKFDGKLENPPKNLRTETWFPQRDLLVHPNVKLFVTQGGLQSADEAIDAEVPLVGIPFLGDQFYNVRKFVQLGIGVKVDALTMDKDALLNGIKKVLSDDSYKKNIRKLKKIMNDQPQSALERAVWWTEYVIRHGGAKHLRTPAANITWAEYFMADVVAAIFGVAVSVTIVVYLALKFLIAKVFGKTKVKTS